ncbi:MAG: hypothetical protein QM796_17420 [Chthoniobacteraceae bacterium]
MKTPRHQQKKTTDVNDDRLNEMLHAARAAKPDPGRVEYGFETRLLARLRSERQAPAQPWYAAAWKLCPAFAAITLVLGVWTWFSPPDFSSHLAQFSETAQITGMFTGEQP